MFSCEQCMRSYQGKTPFFHRIRSNYTHFFRLLPAFKNLKTKINSDYPFQSYLTIFKTSDDDADLKISYAATTAVVYYHP